MQSEPSIPPSINPPELAPAPHPAPNRKRFRWPLIVLLVALLAGLGYWFFGRSESPHTIDLGTVNTVTVNTVPSGKLTAADVAKLDKTNTFFAYFATAAQQQKMVTTTESITALDKASVVGSDFYKVGFDFATKESVFAHDAAFSSLTQDRCYGKTVLYRSQVVTEWQTQPFEKTSPCQVGMQQDYYIADGLNTGGLTAKQAQTFVSYLREQPGLITVKNLELTEHKGKQYLHYSVALTPIVQKGTIYGAQWLMFAFKQTGLDPTAWPYIYHGAGGYGIALEYYVDPVTKLPAYSETLTTPQKDLQGNDKPLDEYNFHRVQYQFGTATFDASAANNDPIKLDW
jgi:hypothetical protein